MQNITTIQLSKRTRDRLLEFGKKRETYDDLLNRLIDFYIEKGTEIGSNSKV